MGSGESITIIISIIAIILSVIAIVMCFKIKQTLSSSGYPIVKTNYFDQSFQVVDSRAEGRFPQNVSHFLKNPSDSVNNSYGSYKTEIVRLIVSDNTRYVFSGVNNSSQENTVYCVIDTPENCKFQVTNMATNILVKLYSNGLSKGEYIVDYGKSINIDVKSHGGSKVLTYSE